MTHAAYVICTAPRSGSTLLCDLLTATGVAGKPASYFYDQSVAEWVADNAVTVAANAPEHDVLAAVLSKVIEQGRNGTRVFGLRQQAPGLAFLCEKLGVLYPDQTSDAGRFHQAFGPTLFIYLSRPDKLAQAISFLKAQQTGLWHVAPDGTEIERLAPHADPTYDRAQLEQTVQMMGGYDRAWTDWFQREGIQPLRLSYDDLAADPVSILRHVLDRLGLDPAVAEGVTPGLKKLADGTSDAWMARFRQETGAG